MNAQKQMHLLVEGLEKLRRASNMGSSCKLEPDEATVLVKVVDNAISFLKGNSDDRVKVKKEIREKSTDSKHSCSKGDKRKSKRSK